MKTSLGIEELLIVKLIRLGSLWLGLSSLSYLRVLASGKSHPPLLQLFALSPSRAVSRKGCLTGHLALFTSPLFLICDNTCNQGSSLILLSAGCFVVGLQFLNRKKWTVSWSWAAYLSSLNTWVNLLQYLVASDISALFVVCLSIVTCLSYCG